MRVFVNGEPCDCDSSLTIADLIERYRLIPETTLVEQNGIALPRREWKRRILRENDRLEILSVASGG